MHRVEADVTASEKDPNQEPSHFACGVSISAKTQEGDEEAAIQNGDNDKEFEKVLYLETLILDNIR
jgi:hypothetical protein